LPIEKLIIDQDVADWREVASLSKRLDVPTEFVDNVSDVYKHVSSADDPVQKGKQILLITTNKGRFIKRCPGTRNYNCCGYMILHIGTFCNMDCSYCILQSYFHPPVLQYFVNHRDMHAELDEAFRIKKTKRFGTGEFTDSMIWESWTDLSTILVPKFSNQSHAVLELKTKTTAIETFKQFDHNRKTIMAWSLNTDRVIKNEEKNTTSLSARLKAAKTCESWGYPLAFHFDPMVLYEGCEDDYRNVITRLFSTVSPENVVWISLGTFRFMPALKPIIQQRFPDSKIIYGEFILGLDKKMRYFKPLRLAFYQKIVNWIRESAPDVFIYFCMEDDEIWKKTIGFTPTERGGLAGMLDSSAVRHCGLDS